MSIFLPPIATRTCRIALYGLLALLATRLAAQPSTDPLPSPEAASAASAPLTAPEPAASSVPAVSASAPTAPDPPASAPGEVPAPAQRAERSYQVGLAVAYGPAYPGSAELAVSAKPIWSIQWGRFRLTSSRASLIEKAPVQGALPGASVDLGQFKDWHFDAALRLDNGRDSGDAKRLEKVTEVRSTVRGRFAAQLRMAERTRLEFTTTTDLLNRGGGTTFAVDLSRRGQWSEAWRWGLGGGVGWGDATHLRGQYGVTPGDAVASGLPVYQPDAGVHEMHLAGQWSYQWTPNWRVGGALSWQHLLGPALDSPLTERRHGLTLTMGLVYIGRP